VGHRIENIEMKKKKFRTVEEVEKFLFKESLKPPKEVEPEEFGRDLYEKIMNKNRRRLRRANRDE
jgi:deoxyhypusine synthase